MRWLEIIELRTVNGSHQEFEYQLKNMLENFHDTAADFTVDVFNRFGLESDISIHLMHHADKPDINRSPEGMQLTDALKKFGLVNYSIWIDRFSR
jgi:hypothetical protein